MTDASTRLADLVEDGTLEIGAGRPRTAGADLPVLRVADVLDGRIQSSGHAEGLPAGHRPRGPKVSKPGDIVLTTKGTVGRVAIMPTDGPAYAYSPQICYFRPVTEGRLEFRYLYYWLKSPEFAAQALPLKSQTDMADFISLQDLFSLRLRLPPVAEQRAITEVLGALDRKIAANDRTVTVADALAESLTRSASSGEVVPLSEVAMVTMGSSPPGFSYSETSDGLPFFQGVRDFGVRFPDRRVWTTRPVRRAAAGDTLLSVRAPVGRTNLAGEELCIGRGLAALRSRAGAPMSLFHQVRAAHNEWAPYESEGTVFGAIRRTQLESIGVPAIDPAQAVRLEERLTALESLIASTLAENTRLAATLKELLPLLMSGKVGVKDAEKSVRGVLRW